jgi:hypothetical protein
MEFVLYLGTQKEVTVTEVNGKRLSRVYRMIKGQPIPVDSEADKFLLLNYTEVSGGCHSCSAKNRPMMSDYSFCQYQNLNLVEYREKWTQHYLNNS